MRISDWSSDVCSSDLNVGHLVGAHLHDHGVMNRADTVSPEAHLSELLVGDHERDQDQVGGERLDGTVNRLTLRLGLHFSIWRVDVRQVTNAPERALHAPVLSY